MTTPASTPAASPAPGGGATPPGAQQGAQPAGAQAPANIAAQAPQPRPAEDHGPEALTPDEETRLGELLAKRDKAAAGGTVRMRVEGGHESIQVGHAVVSRDWTDVPVTMVAALTEGAADAGVTITQDDQES